MYYVKTEDLPPVIDRRNYTCLYVDTLEQIPKGTFFRNLDNPHETCEDYIWISFYNDINMQAWRLIVSMRRVQRHETVVGFDNDEAEDILVTLYNDSIKKILTDDKAPYEFIARGAFLKQS